MESHLSIGIIADDLTGAADCVAPFARRGYPAYVGFNIESESPSPFTVQAGAALAVTTETRDLTLATPDLISSIVQRTANRLQALSPALIYKKIDSTLRGHLRLELEALSAQRPDRIALICPTFPATGRTVRSGILHLRDVPWTNTDFAPRYPLPAPTVRAAFGYHQDPLAEELDLQALRAGTGSLQETLAGLRGVRTVFCDAETTDDLKILAQVVLSRPQHYLPVGSAGLADALAAEMSAMSILQPTGIPSKNQSKSALVWSSEIFTQGRVLVIVGSRHESSRRQAAYLAKRAMISPISIEPDTLGRSDIQGAVQQLRGQLESSQRILLLQSPDREWDRGASGDLCRVAAELLPLFRKIRAFGLIVTGGDTARHLCDTLSVLGLRITGESEPGVALGHLVGDPAAIAGQHTDNLPIITKAGGFGTEETLARCLGLG